MIPIIKSHVVMGKGGKSTFKIIFRNYDLN